MRRLETLFQDYINAPIQIYSGATFKKGLHNLEDAYANTEFGDLIKVRQDIDLGNNSLLLKPGVNLHRENNATISSNNANGTIISEVNGNTPATNSITGKGLIINTVDVSKRIVGNVKYSETFIAFIHSRSEYSKVTVFQNDFPSEIESVISSMTDGNGDIEITFIYNIVDNFWRSQLTCIGGNSSVGKVLKVRALNAGTIKVIGISADDYLTLTYTRFYDIAFDIENESEEGG